MEGDGEGTLGTEVHRRPDARAQTIEPRIVALEDALQRLPPGIGTARGATAEAEVEGRRQSLAALRTTDESHQIAIAHRITADATGHRSQRRRLLLAKPGQGRTDLTEERTTGG